MNSEELELSLRTEFENYLKGVLAGMRQDIADFRNNFESEFEKHKAQMDGAFRDLTERFGSDVQFDKAFTESVVEHLRLARDDGAQLTAQAFSEAQALEPVPVASNYNQLRDAINDISNQTTQSAILRSLVDHVARFTPHGAFFIVKNENFVCWRRFDTNGASDDESVREVHFPVSFDTVLAEAVNSLLTVDSAPRNDDFGYLDSLNFSRPERMFAVPLMARGRGVAVLYADTSNGADVNLQAIESLVRVAGLTVELRAAAAAALQPSVAEPAPTYTPMPAEESQQQPEAEVEQTSTSEWAAPAPFAAQEEQSVAEVEYATEPQVEYATEPEIEYATEPEVEYAEPVQEYDGGISVEEPVTEAPVDAPAAESGYGFEMSPSVVEETPEIAAEEVVEEAPAPVNDFAFASNDSYDASATDEPKPEPVEEYAYAGEPANGNGHTYEAAPEPVVEVAATQPVKSRLSDRYVDLPIEVPEEERRYHNDARRFARLLVSEIKLYNEQKVNEGRDASDLYDRLREAIDRSREMYEKRVQPQVAAKFDYFHYELVSNLAEGNDAKLGASYPGASV